mgnify:FL=1
MPSTNKPQHFEDDNMSESSDNQDSTFSRRGVSHSLFAMDPISQRTCINAITGQKMYCQLTGQPIKQNSLASRQLYAVMDCTAPNGSKDPMKLYYDTPEQYERHRGVKIPRSMKDAWRQKISGLGYSPYGTSNVAPVAKREVTIIN